MTFNVPAMRSPFWKPETVPAAGSGLIAASKPPSTSERPGCTAGRGNPLKAVAANLGLRTRGSEYGNLAAYELGTVGRSTVSRAAFESEYAKLEAKVYRQSGWTYVSTLARRWLGRPGTEVSVADVLSAIPAPLTEAGRLARCRIESGIENLYAASPHDLGFAGLLYESITGPTGEGFPSGEQFVLDGMDRLVQPLAEGLPVRFGQTVKRIAYGTDGVLVETERETFTADGVVVTVPIGVLQSEQIVFEPVLPPFTSDRLVPHRYGTLQ